MRDYLSKDGYDMKRKWFHTADNTVLDCPSVEYKYNRDTYRYEKRIFWVISVIGLIVALMVMLLCNNTIVQTVAGAFMGGILSLIVWLFTVRQQDKMNYELANVDMHIMRIDGHLSYIHDKVQFINPDEYEIVQADSKSLVYRFMHLLQFCVFLYGDKEIDTKNLKLKFSDDKEYGIAEYVEKCEALCQNKFADLIILQGKWDKIIDWNYYIVDYHLNELKKKLMRYKTYVLCGNAPERYTTDDR